MADVTFLLAYNETPLNKNSGWKDDWSKTYTVGAEIAKVAKEYNDRMVSYGYQRRCRVRKLVDTDNDNFYGREKALNHTPVPWDLESDTFFKGQQWLLPHVDPEDKRKIRFFQSLSHAVTGKYTSVTMSRYLSSYTYFNTTNRETILAKAGYYGERKFGITQDAEQIADVYHNGPSSCMNDPDEYPLPDTHPSIVYSRGDLGIAYMTNGNDDGYSARCVVWPEKKMYYHGYGHVTLLYQNLDEAGYTKVTDGEKWEGAHIGAFRDPDDSDEWLMPYVDPCGYASLSADRKYFILSYNGGDYECRSTEGHACEEDSW